jgi:hypothetical protein
MILMAFHQIEEDTLNASILTGSETALILFDPQKGLVLRLVPDHCEK